MSTNPDSARNVAERMQAAAAAFVEAGKAGGITLDYLPRTLPVAEKFAKSSGDIDGMTAYFGEVIRRDTKGFWYDSNGIAMVYAGIEPYVDPDAVIQALLTTGRTTCGTVQIDSSKAYSEAIARLQRQWLDRSVLGNYDSVAALRTSMSADAKTAGQVLALAQEAVLTAQLDWRESLEASPDSLDAIERILGHIHKLAKSDPHRVNAAMVDTTSKTMGAFVGEIIRRYYGGQWRATAAGSYELPYPGAIVDPIARARKRINDGPGENIRMYFNSMTKVIAS